jgi:hypothetical protein
MDNIVRSLEEIELTEAELEVIYGAMEDVDGFKSIDGFFPFFPAGTTHFNIDGTSHFFKECVDNFFVHTTATRF